MDFEAGRTVTKGLKEIPFGLFFYYFPLFMDLRGLLNIQLEYFTLLILKIFITKARGGHKIIFGKIIFHFFIVFTNIPNDLIFFRKIYFVSLFLALGISSDKLDHLSWMQIQKKLLEAQKLNQMCIHKEELTELDVHNRILRYKNYMISMVHKEIVTKDKTPFYNT